MTKIKYTRAVKLYLDKQAKGLKDSEIYEIIVEKYGNSLANKIFATPKKTLEEHATLDPKRNPRSGFRKFFEIKDRSGTVYSTVGGMKLAKSHAQRFANMYDKQMIIHPVKLLR